MNLLIMTRNKRDLRSIGNSIRLFYLRMLLLYWGPFCYPIRLVLKYLSHLSQLMSHQPVCKKHTAGEDEQRMSETNPVRTLCLTRGRSICDIHHHLLRPNCLRRKSHGYQRRSKGGDGRRSHYISCKHRWLRRRGRRLPLAIRHEVIYRLRAPVSHLCPRGPVPCHQYVLY